MESIKENNQSFQISLNALHRGFRNRKDLLYLFSSYIASNPDFKYNSTYLTDSIDSFFEDQACFKAKQIVFYKIIDYLKKETEGKYEIEVVFDSVFKYNTFESKDLEIINDSNNTYYFNRMGEKLFILKLILLNPERIEYQYEIIKYNTNEEWHKVVDSFIKIIRKKYVRE
jgi:hypothetical protein